MVRIYVDADGTPVREEVVRVASRHRVPVTMVSNGSIRPSRDPLVTTITVPKEPDAADRWIAEHISPGDICVTADIPLAQRAVEAGASALRPDGRAFHEGNIGEALAMRDLMADLRAANPLGVGGAGRPYSKADRSRFLQSLESLTRRALRERSGD